MLAFANRLDLETARQRVDVEVLRWRESVCDEERATSCFDPLLSLPGVGTNKVTAFSLRGRDYIALASHYEGQSTTEQGVYFEQDSLLYLVDYASAQSRLVQRIPTSGAYTISFFEQRGDLYLAIANFRGVAGLAESSRIYKWTHGDAPAWADPPAGCSASSSIGDGSFEL
eukprot:578511-Rhodomonas_salina.1